MPNTPKKKKTNSIGDWSKRPAGERGYSNTPKGNYSGNASPRVGGSAPKPSGLKGATKAQIKAAKSMVRKGTGSGAKRK